MQPIDTALALARARAWAESGEARRRREAANLSLAEIAGAVGVAEATVSRWERGRSSPHGPAAARYGELLARLASELLT